ncbi:MAG: N-6 DNA methylase, partial [Bacteroidota bacterium]
DDGISGAMHYTEQISWILFLKFLNDYEENKHDEAILSGKSYNYVIDAQHRWNEWACPKDDKGNTDKKKALTGDDLKDYINKQLFPYLKGFKANTVDLKSLRYKIGATFEFLDNRIASGHTLREVLDIIDTLDFQNQEELFELSHIYENLLKGMGSDGGNSGEFYTPRPVINAMIQAIAPLVGQTVYDGAAGSAGFLVESYMYMTAPGRREKLSTSDWKTLQQDTFFGNEKTPLAYVMGVMNMILHGIESPNIFKINTLTQNIRDIQEKDRYDIIVANPPFGGKEKSQIQQNFPIQSNATELLFLQHFMKNLKVGGKAAIIVPEGVLFQTNNAFAAVKKELLENFNLHTIVSLPAGVFLPYSGVKTDIIFFERKGATTQIWFYEVAPPQKLTKNKPITNELLQEFVDLFKSRKSSVNSWSVDIAEIKDYNLSAKNPNKQQIVEHLTPNDLVVKLKANGQSITTILNEIDDILNDGYGKY